MRRCSFSIIGAVIVLTIVLISFPGSNSTVYAGDDAAVDSAQAVDSSGSPTIFFPETIYDFGKVAQGEKVTHEYAVKNTGDAPLKLIKAKGS